MKKSLMFTAVCFTTVSMFYSSCKKKDDTTTATPAPASTGPSLYTQVGGTTMVTDPAPVSGGPAMIEKGRLTLRSVVDSSIFVIAGDKNISSYFSVLLAEVSAKPEVTTGYVALSENFTNFLCSATGSTNPAYAYGGRSMADAHNPTDNSRITMKVTNAAFNYFLGDIGTGLAQNGVTAPKDSALINALVALLKTTQSAVVQN